MNDLGFYAAPLALNDTDTDAFVKALDAGIRRWFFDRLKAANGGVELGPGPLALFDPSTRDGLDRIFKYRDSYPDWKDKIAFVVQGDSKLGLAKMHQSWPRSGFGKWAHINPGFCMRIAKMVCDQISESLHVRCIVSNPAHLIVKPPNGSELKAHHDQMSPAYLLRALREHMNSDDTSTTAWARKHGIQCLVHLEGGHSQQDGCTYIVGPMSPRRLLLCLEALEAGVVSAPDGWFDLKKGPYFLNWKSLLPSFNLILSEAGESPLSIIPMVHSSSSPFFLMWPAGFPHGSSTNLKRRITTTVPLKLLDEAVDGGDDRCSKKPKLTESSESRPRFLKRALCFNQLHHSDEEIRKKASEWLLSDKASYEEGISHKSPHLARRWVDQDGFYSSLAPTDEDVKALEKAAGFS